MYSVLFELVEDPEDLGITAEWLNDLQGVSYYEFVEEPINEDKQDVLKNLAKAFNYKTEDLVTTTERVNGKGLLKIRFNNVDNYFKDGFKAFNAAVAKMDFNTFVRNEPTLALLRVLRKNFTLVFDPNVGYVQNFDEWLRNALESNETYNTRWYYIGKIFKYYD